MFPCWLFQKLKEENEGLTEEVLEEVSHIHFGLPTGESQLPSAAVLLFHMKHPQGTEESHRLPTPQLPTHVITSDQ